jgi:hypothetical protein
VNQILDFEEIAQPTPLLAAGAHVGSTPGDPGALWPSTGLVLLPECVELFIHIFLPFHAGGVK